MVLSMEEALKRAEKVIVQGTANYKDRLVEHLNILERALTEDDRAQSILTANTIKGEAGISGWPLVSVIAGWLRISLEAESGPCMTKVPALHLASLRILVDEDLRGEAPAGQKLVRGLYTLLDKKGLIPASSTGTDNSISAE